MKIDEFESQVMSMVYEDIRQRFAGFSDLAHGWEHIQRVYKLGLSLAGQEQADTFIVGMAALMHDIGHLSTEQTKHHSELSLSMAQETLSRYQVSGDRQQAILHAIEAHSFSLGIEPRTLEARVVRDSDRLDALGAVGILRWAITGTVRNKGETQTYHPDDPFAEWHTLDDRSYMLDHFFSKLLKLEGSMATESGMALARKRTAFMRVYLDEFRKELSETAGKT
jgi:uncharacterized protein